MLMSEVKEKEEKLSGRLDDLASDHQHLGDYLAVRVDISGDQELGSVIGFGDDLQQMKDLVNEDMKSKNPGNEYHIFHPQEKEKTAREISTIFMPGNKFRLDKK